MNRYPDNRMRDMTTDNSDALIRVAAFEHVRRLAEMYDFLTAIALPPRFFSFRGVRIALINPPLNQSRQCKTRTRSSLAEYWTARRELAASGVDMVSRASSRSRLFLRKWRRLCVHLKTKVCCSLSTDHDLNLFKKLCPRRISSFTDAMRRLCRPL